MGELSFIKPIESPRALILKLLAITTMALLHLSSVPAPLEALTLQQQQQQQQHHHHQQQQPQHPQPLRSIPLMQLVSQYRGQKVDQLGSPKSAMLAADLSKHSPDKQLTQATHLSHQFMGQKHRRPESSSSIFSDIEDLSDSSIKTRAGQIQISSEEPTQGKQATGAPPVQQPNEPANFEDLLARIEFIAPMDTELSVKQNSKLKSSYNEKATSATADANNKTTMRFFRNNKTFASIVHTNRNDNNSHRRLINCHLVDLEKHAPDVALFESKYDIRTVDIEFKDLMGIIESCTEIARFKSPRVGGSSQQPVTMASVATSKGPAGGVRPILVVGRPVGQVTAPQQQQYQHHNQHQPQNQQQPAKTNVETFRAVMSGSLDNQLKQLGPTIDDSPKLDLPGQSILGSGSGSQRLRRWLKLRHSPDDSYGHYSSSPRTLGPDNRELLYHNGHSHPGEVLSQALAKVGETSKKLVLGEVTPPASAVDGHSGGIRAALQEITSYDTTDLLAIWRGILPGTNWCGMGDRATSYNDLGFESDIDICCRAHDFCPIRLSAFSSGYGLFNWSFYTRSHCTCDQNFLDCLQRADSPLSAVVMKFYFNIMKTTCLHDNETYALSGAQVHSGSGPVTVRLDGHQAQAQHREHQHQHHNQQRQQQTEHQPRVSLLPIRFSARSDKRQNHGHQLMSHEASPAIPALTQSQLLTANFDMPPAQAKPNSQPSARS